MKLRRHLRSRIHCFEGPLENEKRVPTTDMEEPSQQRGRLSWTTKDRGSSLESAARERPPHCLLSPEDGLAHMPEAEPEGDVEEERITCPTLSTEEPTSF